MDLKRITHNQPFTNKSFTPNRQTDNGDGIKRLPGKSTHYGAVKNKTEDPRRTPFRQRNTIPLTPSKQPKTTIFNIQTASLNKDNYTRKNTTSFDEFGVVKPNRRKETKKKAENTKKIHTLKEDQNIINEYLTYTVKAGDYKLFTNAPGSTVGIDDIQTVGTPRNSIAASTGDRKKNKSITMKDQNIELKIDADILSITNPEKCPKKDIKHTEYTKAVEQNKAENMMRIYTALGATSELSNKYYKTDADSAAVPKKKRKIKKTNLNPKIMPFRRNSPVRHRKQKRIRTPDASPPTEVAEWAPYSICKHTKPYYEAWVDTTLAAVSKEAKKGGKMYLEKQKVIDKLKKALVSRPDSSELMYGKFSDQRNVGKIKVNT